MRIYVIFYPGLWLGGKAVVIAESDEQAIQMLKDDPQFIRKKGQSEPRIEEWYDLSTPLVIYNDNGDY